MTLPESLKLPTNHFLYLKTPLEEAALFLHGFTGHEALSQLFRFRLTLSADIRASIDFSKIIGQPVSFGIQSDNWQDQARHVHGLAVEFSQGEQSERATSFSMTVAPAIWKLTRNVRSRVFQHLSIPDILHRVFQGFDVDFQIQGTFEPREYCTQYQESDFSFAARLMEEEGIYFFFRFSLGSHQLVLANSPESHPDIPGDPALLFDPMDGGLREEKRISLWQKLQSWGPGKHTLWDHHFQIPHKKLAASKITLKAVQVGTVAHNLRLASNEEMEVYEHSPRYAHRFDGIGKAGAENPDRLRQIFEDNARTAQIRIQQAEARRLLIDGTSNHRNLLAGHKFSLKGHPHGDGPYVFTEISHNAHESDHHSNSSGQSAHYSNGFACLPYALPYRPPRSIPNPVVNGPISAVVVGPKGEEIFTDKFGRVKVQFHWDREGQQDQDSSCWLRTVTPWAGKHWGMVQIPRVGQEVIVQFMEGDPDRPIIMGGVYNPDQMPPFPLPEKKTVSGWKSHSTPGGKGYNELSFDDKKGAELINLHAQKDLHAEVKNHSRIHVGHDASLTVDGNLVEHFNSNHAEVVAEERWLKAERIIIEADEICLKSGGNFIRIGPGGVEIEGKMVELNCGSSPSNSAISGLPCIKP